ncbi:MAG TPA: M48 family metallopeptidase [Terracidiphilus sp.]
MKRVFGLAVVLLIAGAGMYLAQRRKQADAVTANAVVDLAADWQRDASRIPMHMTRISDAEEVRIGNELASRYADRDLDAEQKATEQYVEKIGAALAAHAQRKLPFHFHLVPDRGLVNAFALPGGQVFIGQGLLDLMRSEDEVAFVLGHEVEHVDHFHSMERVQVEARLRKVDFGALSELAQLPITLWQTGYSKDEEAEADREGLRLACVAGYSPRGALDLLNRLVKLRQDFVVQSKTPTGELSRLAVEGLEGYFRSHPLPSERLTQAQAVIAEDHLPLDRTLRPFHVEYEITSQ